MSQLITQCKIAHALGMVRGIIEDHYEFSLTGRNESKGKILREHLDFLYDTLVCPPPQVDPDICHLKVQVPVYTDNAVIVQIDEADVP